MLSHTDLRGKQLSIVRIEPDRVSLPVVAWLATLPGDAVAHGVDMARHGSAIHIDGAD